jgi:predicted Zn finger-like uncharacterized protein
MIITCKACNTSFNLDDKMLKPTGSKVRCSICATVFTAFPQQAAATARPAETVAPDTAPPTETGPEPDPALSAAGSPAEPDLPAAADTVEGHTPETDVLEEDAGALLSASADLDFALDDDLDPDLPSGQTDEDGAATVIADLDDDLDRLLDGQTPEAETGISDLDLEDLDLDVSLPTDVDSEATATVIAGLDDDALDLDGDYSLEPEDAIRSAAAADDGLPGSLEDIDDLDLTLDVERGGGALPADVPVAKAGGASLDDLSLDFDLETEADMAEAASPADQGLAADDELDLGLGLDLDDEGSLKVTPEAGPTALEDDLDLSNLEELLKDDEEIGEDSATMVIDEDQELTLDLDDEMSMPEAEAAGGADETLEDLAFNLDGDAKAESHDFDLSDDADQEIDLSEIEKMLEEPETANAKFSSVPEQDLDLDIEASLETEKWMSDTGDDDQLVMDEELDLSELEQVLEDIDTGATDDTREDTELELDLGDGETLGTPTETVAVDNSLDFDLSDFEDTAPPKSGTETSFRESDDMELEFEMEEGSHAEPNLKDEGLETTVVVPEPKAEKAQKAPFEPAGIAKPVRKPKPVKKGMSKSLVFLLIIAILGGGGYGTYYLLDRNGIDIPFLSDYLKPAAHDPGNLKLTTFDVNSKFVDNAGVGKLFVISGKVKNGYAENRGMITLTGKIFSTGKVPVHEEKVYCGNVMSDLELANLEWDKIQARLSNRLGDNRSNVKVEPGNSIPFMVVFSGIPDDLEEFTIEVTGSTSLK